MELPHWPYWRRNPLGGTQIWYTDWGDRPFDKPDMGERNEGAVRDLKRLAERYGAGEKDPERGSRDQEATDPP